MRYNLLRLRGEAVANQQPLQPWPLLPVFLLYACHPRSGSPPPCCTICCYYFTGGSTNVRDSQHSPPVPPHGPPPPVSSPPNLPCPPGVFTRSSRSTRSTSVLLTENCLLPANNGSTGITRGSPLFIMLDDLVRRLRGLKIRNRLKHFSSPRNSLLPSLRVIYTGHPRVEGRTEGRENRSLLLKIQNFLYGGNSFSYFLFLCIRFDEERKMMFDTKRNRTIDSSHFVENSKSIEKFPSQIRYTLPSPSLFLSFTLFGSLYLRILTNSLPTWNIWHNRCFLFNERYRRTMRRNRAGDSSRNCIVENRRRSSRMGGPIDVSREYSKIIRTTYPLSQSLKAFLKKYP